MDVGFYLGELLMQQGEVSVPGLGYFVQARVSGYYDENERTFYPPYHQAQFDVQSIDDDSLAEYIAAKKNISIASARYFAEKYITNLKQQALITEIPIGNLGWFYTELAQLTFRPAPKIQDDTIFYGYEPVSINKANDNRPLEERPSVELNFAGRTVPSKPVVTEEVEHTFVQEPVVAAGSVNIPSYQIEPESQVASDFFDPEEDETTSSFSGPLRAIVFVLIGIIIVGVGIFALYRYQPDTFAKITFWKQEQPPVVQPKPAPVVKPADTLSGDTLRVDTNAITSAPAPTPDTIVQPATKSKIISETPVDQGTPTKSKILSVTPVDQGKVIDKKTIVVSKNPINPTVVPLPNTPKKKETVVSQQVIAGAKPTATKTKPSATAAPVSNTSLIAKPSDAVGTHRYEVYTNTGSLSIAEANTLIKKLRKSGLDPRVVTDAPGSLIQISIGHFATKQEALDLAMKEIEAGHIPGGNAFPFQIIPTK